MRPWMQAAVVALAAVAAVVRLDSAAVEQWFSTTLYPHVQRVLTPLSNAVPFALFDLITLGGSALLVVSLVRSARRARRDRSARPLARTLASVAAALAVVYLAFLAVWGLNYRRVPMAGRLAMSDTRPGPAAVLALGLDAAERMNALHPAAHRAGWLQDPRDDTALRSAFAFVQQDLSDAPPAVPGRLKTTVYGPYFRWTGVDGMINPLTLEVIANPDLLPFERAFVAAHEWAHLAGYAHEAEANFVGWLTCVRGGVPSQYSAWLYLYWQVNGDVAPEARAMLRAALDPGPRRDIDAIVERLRRGQLPLLRTASWRVYDRYLRANRVEEGVRSYGEVVTLLLRARFEDGWVPVRAPEASSR